MTLSRRLGLVTMSKLVNLSLKNIGIYGHNGKRFSKKTKYTLVID